MRPAAFTVLFMLAACASVAMPGIPANPGARSAAGPELTPYQRALTFTLEAPRPQSMGPDLRLWATHYHTPVVRPAGAGAAGALPLTGVSGLAISPPLTLSDWCSAALQGSVSVKHGARATAYAYVDANGPEQADCDAFMGNLSDGVKRATRHARFKKVAHPLGCGVRNLPLMPFRTIAVDTDLIALGSVLYVPELRGRAFRYNDHDYVHDGYLFAGDRGGAIQGRHIDVFLVDEGFEGLEDLFASTQKRTFAAHIVAREDPLAMAVSKSQSDSCEPAGS